MPSLLIRSEDTGDAWQIWPSADSIPPGTIQETRSYIFELHDAEGAPDTDLLIDEVPLEALRFILGRFRVAYLPPKLCKN